MATDAQLLRLTPTIRSVRRSCDCRRAPVLTGIEHASTWRNIVRSVWHASRLGVAVIALIGTAMLTGGAVAAPSHTQRPASAAQTTTPGSCESLTALTLPNTVVTSAAVAAASGTVPASCRVHATVTHPPAGDTVNI